MAAAKLPPRLLHLYRRQAILDHQLTFCPVKDYTGGGYSIARQLWDAGISTPVFPVREMADHIYHIAHGTAAIAPEKRLNHAHKQKQTEINSHAFAVRLDPRALADRLGPR